jgi:hypothetical protein
MVRNWVKITAPDGDVYYFNIKTKTSSWEAPWERAHGFRSGAQQQRAPPPQQPQPQPPPPAAAAAVQQQA